MQEIRFHGRGGQGTVVASVILAKAIFKADYYVQTFPSFGVERRGAPVEAYLRIDKKKILIRSNIYEPDHVVIQDPKLLLTVNVTNGLKPGGWILINSGNKPEDLKPFSGFKLAFVDATGIAIRLGLGTRTHPIINTAMVGAFARMMNFPTFNILADVIEEEIPVKQSLNIEAAKEAYEKVTLFGIIK